jgi:hypothetical protein
MRVAIGPCFAVRFVLLALFSMTPGKASVVARSSNDAANLTRM